MAIVSTLTVTMRLTSSRMYRERLELPPPLPRVGVALAQLLVDIAERRWHGASGGWHEIASQG